MDPWQNFICSCEDDCRGNKTLFQCATGLCVDLLNKLKEDMQFDYEMMQARDNQWGNYIDDSVSSNPYIEAKSMFYDANRIICESFVILIMFENPYIFTVTEQYVVCLVHV